MADPPTTEQINYKRLLECYMYMVLVCEGTTYHDGGVISFDPVFTLSQFELREISRINDLAWRLRNVMNDQSPETTKLSPGFEGMSAKEQGLSVDACPYDPGAQRTAWVVGWYIATERKLQETLAMTETTVTVTDDLMADPTVHAFVASELQRLGSLVLRREQCPQLNTIESDRDIQGGRPCIAGTRVPASAILEFHEAGYTPTAIIREYPTLSPEQVAAAIAFMRQATICPRCGWEAEPIAGIGPFCPNPDCDAFDDMRPLSHEHCR